jgi:molecular chaperone GrpE
LKRLKESFLLCSVDDWEWYGSNYNVERTASFEEFVSALSKSAKFKEELNEIRDIIENDPPLNNSRDEEKAKEIESVVISLRSEIECLRSESEQKLEKIARLEKDVQRANEEYWDCRHSSDAKIEKQKIVANADFLKTLIPVFDEMLIALEHKESEKFASGVELVLHNLFKELNKNGFKRIEINRNDDFDSLTCEAIAEVEGRDDGKIAQVVQNGYVFKEDILRYAKVVVYSSEKTVEEEVQK